MTAGDAMRRPQFENRMRRARSRAVVSFRLVSFRLAYFRLAYFRLPSVPFAPSSSAMRNSWLYFALRSERHGAPVLI